MADKEVRIDIKTKADSTAIKNAKKAVKELTDELVIGTKAIEERQQEETYLQKRTKATQGAFHDLEKATKKVTAAYYDLDKSEASIASEEDKRRVKALGAQFENVSKSGEKLATVQQKAGRQTRHTGLAFLEFSRAVEDAQYGVRGILNNIPQMVLLMGGSGGLAGVISIAAVAMSQLFERLTKVEEKLPETTDRLEELKKALVDIHEEIGRENFEGYIKRFNAMDSILKRENTALTANVKLLSEKRKGQLAIAAIQDDIDLALVAQKERSDPNYTSDQATSDRDAIIRRKIGRDLEEAEAVAQDKMTQVTEDRLHTNKEIAKTEQDILAHDQKTEKLKAELSELRVKEAEAARLNKRADVAIDGPIDQIMGRDNALADRKSASEWFSADDSARLKSVNVELTDLQSTTKTAKLKLTELEEELKDRDQEVRLMINETEVLVDIARGMADQQTILSDVETANRELEQNAQEFTSSLASIKELAKETSESQHADKVALTVIAGEMSTAAENGSLAIGELESLNTQIAGFALMTGGATTKTGQKLKEVQDMVVNLMAQVRALEIGQVRIQTESNKRQTQAQATRGK